VPEFKDFGRRHSSNRQDRSFNDENAHLQIVLQSLFCKIKNLSFKISRHGAPRCVNVAKCKGAGLGWSNTDNCNPYHIWADTLSGSSYWSLYLNNGSLNTNAYPGTLAFTVRYLPKLYIFSEHTVLHPQRCVCWIWILKK